MIVMKTVRENPLFEAALQRKWDPEFFVTDIGFYCVLTISDFMDDWKSSKVLGRNISGENEVDAGVVFPGTNHIRENHCFQKGSLQGNNLKPDPIVSPFLIKILVDTIAVTGSRVEGRFSNIQRDHHLINKLHFRHLKFFGFGLKKFGQRWKKQQAWQACISKLC